MNKSILFIDRVTPKPYVVSDSTIGRMGGTEATVCRIARELSQRYMVFIEQRGRTEHITNGTIVYLSEDCVSPVVPAVVITLRDGKVFRQAKEKYPTARHYLWLHDVVGDAYKEHLEQTLSDGEHDLICVSQWHKVNVTNNLVQLIIKGNIKGQVIYNPIERYERNPELAVNPYQLIFFSSPHKGLSQAIELFSALRKKDERYTMLVANPGYYEDHKELPEGVTNLTDLNLTHLGLMGLVQQSLCMFYPQTVFPETFGIVYGEASACGTPVLGHSLGAASEVLDNMKQLVNCRDPEIVIKTVMSWSAGERPTVSLNKQFTIEEVTRSWIKLIEFGEKNQ